MKTIKKEVDVLACEICGEEIKRETSPYTINTPHDNYNFHTKCSESLLIKEAKKNQ